MGRILVGSIKVFLKGILVGVPYLFMVVIVSFLEKDKRKACISFVIKKITSVLEGQPFAIMAKLESYKKITMEHMNRKKLLLNRQLMLWFEILERKKTRKRKKMEREGQSVLFVPIIPFRLVYLRVSFLFHIIHYVENQLTIELCTCVNLISCVKHNALFEEN